MLVYLVISACVTLLDIVLLVLFVELFFVHYLIAVTVSYSLAILMKFSLTKKFVFQSTKGFWMGQLARFTTISASGLLLTNMVMFVGVDLFHIQYILSKIWAVGIVFFWTFVMHNVFSFKSRNTVTISTSAK
jgi:putative flippase GtrA